MKLIRKYDAPARSALFGDLFEDFWRDYETGTSKLTPAVDITEDKNKYTVHADLPGIKQEDVKIELEDNVLTISGERKHEKEENDEKQHYHYYERNFGAFSRKFTLPKDADYDKIDAKMDKGELKVIIPKTETKKPKEIKIK